jgi:GT2 family glycosyltransferase
MGGSLHNLALLIPTRNRPDILATTLGELQKAGFGDVALWVYDDCSTDAEAIPRVIKSWPGAKVLRGTQRVGQAEGRNILMRACGKEFGLLIDDDSFPMHSTGLQRHLDEPRDTRRAITTFQYLDVPTQRLSTPKELGEGVARTFQGGGSLFHIPTVMGLGGFRSFFIYGYEEPELAMRIQMKGLQIWYDPSVVIHHNHFETPNECRDHQEYDYLYARNSILMSSLNMPLWVGLPHGLARSLRRSFFRHRNASAKLHGTLAGIWFSFSLWRDRTPGSSRKALEFIQFNRRCPR